MTLNRIKAELAGLVPEFEILSASLGIFADIWNQVRSRVFFFGLADQGTPVPQRGCGFCS